MGIHSRDRSYECLLLLTVVIGGTRVNNVPCPPIIPRDPLMDSLAVDVDGLRVFDWRKELQSR